MAFGISAVILSLGLIAAPEAFAQDAMQLDIDFKNSLSQGPHVEGSHVRGTRHEEEGQNVREHHGEGRRADKRSRREKGRPVEAIARR
jgi:hypothetical protein